MLQEREQHLVFPDIWKLILYTLSEAFSYGSYLFINLLLLSFYWMFDLNRKNLDLLIMMRVSKQFYTMLTQNDYFWVVPASNMVREYALMPNPSILKIFFLSFSFHLFIFSFLFTLLWFILIWYLLFTANYVKHYDDFTVFSKHFEKVQAIGKTLNNRIIAERIYRVPEYDFI